MNIEQNAASENIEFVVLDYNSQDGLEGWMLSEMKEHLDSGLVRYFKERSALNFFMAHAKNLVHKLATGDILCNLDADNFTGKDLADYLRRLLPAPGCFGTPGNQGQIAGRIAIWRKDFWRLGGYNEEFRWGWGCDDRDFVARAEKMGLVRRWIDLGVLDGFGAIIHQGDPSEFLSAQPNRVRSSSVHEKIKAWNMEHGHFIANHGYIWGDGRVWDHEGRERVVA